MKKIICLLLTLYTGLYAQTDLQQRYPTIKKVVIWGMMHKGHTHHWIHKAYYDAFKHMGFDTYWLADTPHPDFDFENTLFFIHGVEDTHAPCRDDCRYILHNVTNPRYRPLFENDCAVALQVYTHDCLTRNVVKIDTCTYFDYSDKCIYMPWATDLLPHEIDAVKEKLRTQPIRRSRTIHYVGSVGGTDQFENQSTVSPFMNVCSQRNIPFIIHQHIDMDRHIAYIQQSYIAPAIQSSWQCRQGYIPCRIFKNISYGHMGITNSKTVYELFNGKILYDEDTTKLAEKALDQVETFKQEDLFALMDFVRDYHTYINRINLLLGFMNVIKPL